MEKFYQVLEENFTKKEIHTIISLITYESEFESYEVDSIIGFLKVEEVNNELKKKIPLTNEEWMELEGRGYIPRFEKEVSWLSYNIYLLSNNKIIIADEQKNILKEINVKDYEDTGFLVYKDILYIYSDKKIYEVPLNNLNKVKVVNVV